MGSWPSEPIFRGGRVCRRRFFNGLRRGRVLRNEANPMVLELEKLVKRPEVGTFEGRFIAREAAEAVPWRRGRREGDVERAAGFEERGFERCDAARAPVGLKHLFDAEKLSGSGGLVLV